MIAFTSEIKSVRYRNKSRKEHKTYTKTIKFYWKTLNITQINLRQPIYNKTWQADSKINTENQRAYTGQGISRGIRHMCGSRDRRISYKAM